MSTVSTVSTKLSDFLNERPTKHICVQDGQVHVLMPVIRGDIIGTDNTCKSLTQLYNYCQPQGQEYIGLEIQNYIDCLKFDLLLLSASNQANLPIYFAKLKRLEDLKFYKDLMLLSLALQGFRTSLEKYEYPAAMLMVLAHKTNLFAIHLNDHEQNKLPYGNTRTQNPVFSAMHNYKQAQNKADYRGFGVILREQLRSVTLQSGKVFSKETIIEQVRSGEQSMLFADVLSAVSKVIEQVAGNVGYLLGEPLETNMYEYFNMQKEDAQPPIEQMINYIIAQAKLDDLFWWNKNSSKFGYVQAIYPEPDMFVRKTAILVQFFVACINIYCYMHKMSDADFGLVLDQNEALANGLIAEVCSALSSALDDVEHVIFDFIKKNYKAFKIANQDFDFMSSKDLFDKRAFDVLGADHSDEFLVHVPLTAGVVISPYDCVSRAGCILVNFAIVAQQLLGALTGKAYTRVVPFVNEQIRLFRVKPDDKFQASPEQAIDFFQAIDVRGVSYSSVLHPLLAFWDREKEKTPIQMKELLRRVYSEHSGLFANKVCDKKEDGSSCLYYMAKYNFLNQTCVSLIKDRLIIEDLTAPIQQGHDQDYSPLYWLCYHSSGGLLQAMFDGSDNLKTGLTIKHLTTTIKQGVRNGSSPLYWLCHPKGITLLHAIFTAKPDLKTGLTIEHLTTTIQEGHDQGYSPLYWLCSHPQGITLLHAIFTAKPALKTNLTIEHLTTTIQQGQDRNYSPLHRLCSCSTSMSSSRWLLRDIFQANDRLKKAALGICCAAIQQVQDRGNSSWLSSYEGVGFFKYMWQAAESKDVFTIQYLTTIQQRGISLLQALSGDASDIAFLKSMLTENSRLKAELNIQHLTTAMPHGSIYEGCFSLHSLCRYEAGIDLLQTIFETPEAKAGLTIQCLTAVIRVGMYKNASILGELSCKPKGKQFLQEIITANQDKLADYFRDSTTISADTGCYPLYELCCKPEGITLLHAIFTAKPELKTGLTIEHLTTEFLTGPNQGKSLLYALGFHVTGIELLQSIIAININAFQRYFSQLIAIGPNGSCERLYGLCCKPEGVAVLQTILTAQPELIVPLTIEQLTVASRESPNTGKSLLYFLCCNQRGIDVLNKIFGGNQTLQADLTIEHLTAVVSEGEGGGCSPLYWLCRSRGIKVLQAIFADKPQLKTGLTIEHLTTVVSEGEGRGSSPLYWLCSSYQGIKVLQAIFEYKPKLKNDLTIEHLTAVVSEGEGRGCSPLYWLCRSPGIEVLQDIFATKPELQTGLTIAHLTTTIQQGQAEGCSPLYWLCHPEGIVLLKTFKATFIQEYLTLQHLITESLEDRHQRSLLNALNHEAGMQLLQEIIRRQMDVEAYFRRLTALILVGPNKGYSQLYLLCEKKEGIALLRTIFIVNPTLKNELTIEYLTDVVMDDPNRRKSLLYLLCYCKGDTLSSVGVELLQDLFDGNYKLINELTIAHLTTVSHKYPDEGKSPFFFLSSNEKGITLLDTLFSSNRELQAGLTIEHLTTTVTTTVGEVLPLSALCCYSNGRVLLRRLLFSESKLIERLTIDDLTMLSEYPPAFFILCNDIDFLKQICESKENFLEGLTIQDLLFRESPENKSPLYFLCTSPTGRNFLTYIFQKTKLMQKLKIQHLMNPKYGSVFYKLYKTDHAFLKKILEETGLVRKITAKMLRRPLAKGRHKRDTLRDRIQAIDLEQGRQPGVLIAHIPDDDLSSKKVSRSLSSSEYEARSPSSSEDEIRAPRSKCRSS